jgi:hypothetical protein
MNLCLGHHLLLLSSFSTIKPFVIIAIFAVVIVKAFAIIISFEEFTSTSFVVLW